MYSNTFLTIMTKCVLHLYFNLAHQYSLPLTQELEAQLQRPHVLSIKPRVRVGLPTSTPTHHTHLTPLPLPLSFPPNHRNSRSPLISNNTQTPANNEPNCVPGELEGEEQDIVGVGEENGEEDNKDFSSETTPQRYANYPIP